MYTRVQLCTLVVLEYYIYDLVRVVFRFYTAAIHVTMVDLLLTTKFSIFSSTSTKFSSRFCIKTSKSMYKIPKYEQNT